MTQTPFDTVNAPAWPFRLLRSVRRSLLMVDDGERRSLADLRRAADTVILLSRIYYIFVAYSIGGTTLLPFDKAYMGGPPTAPLWPIRLSQQITGNDWLSYSNAVTAVGLLFAVAAMLAPRMLVWRVGTFVYLLAHIALRNSYGSIDHGLHVLLFVSFALLFLPRRSPEGKLTHRDTVAALTTLWLAQTALLLPYTLSGFWKIRHSGLELLSPDAMPRILLDRVLAEADNLPRLLPFVAQHDLLATAMWLLTLYIECFALLVVFRPHLHRPFGAVLMLFHVASGWLMNIAFSSNIFMLGIFLVLSPLAPARSSVFGAVRSLPLIGIPFRTVQRLRSTQQRGAISQLWLVYDGECPMCSNYSRMVHLRQSVEEFILVDARSDDPIVEEIRNIPHDLNTGMVVKIGNRFYVGHEAFHVLALLSENRGAFSRINRFVFSSPLAARVGYPLLKAARWVVLKLKGVAPIRSGG